MIDDFRGDNRWLSNFWSVPIEFEGTVYPSTEHAYQAAKTLDPDERAQFLKNSFRQAKALGYKVTLRPDWESIKLGVMEYVLQEKFKNPELRQKLLDTGEEELVEGNTWGDTYWGVCDGEGENHLGKLLMKIRDELRKV